MLASSLLMPIDQVSIQALRENFQMHAIDLKTEATLVWTSIQLANILLHQGINILCIDNLLLLEFGSHFIGCRLELESPNGTCNGNRLYSSLGV